MKREESLQLRLWNLNTGVCALQKSIQNAEGGDDTCFQCLFTFALIGGNLTDQLTGSHWGIGSGIQISET